jgi:hypothetical protein
MSLLAFFILLLMPAQSKLFTWGNALIYHRLLWGMIDGMVCISIITLLCISLINSSTSFKDKFFYVFFGIDQVSAFESKPDGMIDLCFQLEFTKHKGHGRVTGIKLEELLPDGTVSTERVWHTDGREGHRAIAVLDPSGRRCDRENGDLCLPETADQQLMIFVHNPLQQGHPAFNTTIEYEDGYRQKISWW